VSVVYLLVPLALLIVFVAIGAYVWAARHGQFDDTETPAIRMLHDEEPGTKGPSDARAPGPGDTPPHIGPGNEQRSL